MHIFARDGDTNTTALPHLPFVWSPSGSWDGNDGKWSTFEINTGDGNAAGAGQNFKILISTSWPVTEVPAQADWCSDSECAKALGIELENASQPHGLDTSSSTSWSELGLYTFSSPTYWSGGSVNGTWGKMPVGLGPTSESSQVQRGQLVVENANEALFMGLFGLGFWPVSTGSSPQNTWLNNINASGELIPSASFGYGAGASYQNGGKDILGSLTLGGYDQSRFDNATRIDVAFSTAQNTSLVVGVQNIVYHPDRGNDYSLTPSTQETFYAAIDSTLPSNFQKVYAILLPTNSN